MTGVEMAEQFADNIDSLELNRRLLSARNKNHAYRLGRHDGFLAGLEAGRPKWHDLRKDPEDLPNCVHGHVVFNQDLDRVIIRDGRFEFLDGYEANVIAWCEVPRFEEVEELLEGK